MVVRMRQIRLHSSLGADLIRARRDAGLTQGALAAMAEVSLPTLRQAERGRGSVGCYARLAKAVGQEISGRALPPGAAIGERLAILRERQKLGRRSVAALAGCSPTTLAAIEGGANGHLAVVARVADALGVRLGLTLAGATLGFWDAAGVSSCYHGWTTPPALLQLLYPLVDGEFGLDPCSPVRRGPGAPVRARLRFTAEDNGLERPWRAETVFVNPPYGRELTAWVEKARTEVDEKRAGLVIALVPARTDTRWWHDNVAQAADVWMLRGRLAFGDGQQAAPFPSALVIWGANQLHREMMSAAFPRAWHVRAPHSDYGLGVLSKEAA